MSQDDLFATEPQPNVVTSEDISVAPGVSSSCPSKLQNTFNRLIFFQWDENTEHPFFITLSSQFGKEIKESWIKSTLSPKSRENKSFLMAKRFPYSGKSILVRLKVYFENNKRNSFARKFIYE